MAVIGDDRVEIKSARGMVTLPLIGLLTAAGLVALMATKGMSLPFWALVVMLVFCLGAVPVSVMALIGAIVGTDAIVDARKGSVTWQQGYLGMGIGTKELVPFDRIEHLEITVEGEAPDRWHGQSDDLRQFALVLVKKSGKRLTLAQVPVPAYGQADGMDRTLAVGTAVAALTGVQVRLPEGWELIEIDTETGEETSGAAEQSKPGKGERGRSR